MARITATIETADERKQRKQRMKNGSKNGKAVVTTLPIRQEAEWTLGKVTGGKAFHALLKTSTGHVTLCSGKPAKTDRRRHQHRDDISCNACKAKVSGLLEATA